MMACAALGVDSFTGALRTLVVTYSVRVNELKNLEGADFDNLHQHVDQLRIVAHQAQLN